MKKIFALIVVMILALSFAIPIFAAPKDGNKKFEFAVEVKPLEYNKVAEYNFVLKEQGLAIMGKTRVTLLFPPGTRLEPPVPIEKVTQKFIIEGTRNEVLKPELITKFEGREVFVIRFTLNLSDSDDREIIYDRLIIHIPPICNIITPRSEVMPGEIFVYGLNIGNHTPSYNSIVRFQKITRITMVIDKKVALVDGKKIEMPVAPYIKNGYSMVELKTITFALGGEIDYFDSKTKNVVFTIDKNMFEMTVGSKVAKHQSYQFDLPVAPEIQQKNMMVPVAFLKEIGAKIDFNLQRKEVTIVYKHNNGR